MVQDEKITGSKPLTDDLEPYRRLVDLQKQMIELVRQHERTRIECAELREQLLDEMDKRNPRWNARRIIGRLATRPGRYLSEKWLARVERRPNGALLPSFQIRRPIQP